MRFSCGFKRVSQLPVFSRHPRDRVSHCIRARCFKIDHIQEMLSRKNVGVYTTHLQVFLFNILFLYQLITETFSFLSLGNVD